MTYWKFGEGYSYRYPGLKKTGWSKTLAGVPKAAKGTPAKKKKQGTGSPRKKVQKRRKTTMAKKKSKKRSGFRLPGGVGPKGILMGALGLMVAPRLIPVQSPGAVKLAAGLGLRALKVGGGGPLAAVGIMELVTQYAGGVIGGVPLLGVGNGGYTRCDY